MNDARTALRSLLIYGTAIPLALILGYLLANPLDMGSFTLIGVVFLIICMPFLLRSHYAFMLLAWNMGAVVFFLPGRMGLWVVAILISFAISFTHQILDKKVQFLSVPELTRPLLALAVVVIATAELRGGFGLRSMGGGSVGGKRYILILVAILGYFALTTVHIPKERVGRYIGLFYLSSAAGAIGITYFILPDFMRFIFLFIPPPMMSFDQKTGIFGLLRPLATAGPAVLWFMLARHGLRRMLTPGHRHLLVLFAVVFCLTQFSGSRLALIGTLMVLGVQFWLEGLFRTKWSLIFGLAFILMGAATVPFISKLPLSIQRTLAFLPIEVDPIAKESAAGSSEWRLQMWQVALPQIPQYLLLGKGYAITQQEFGFMLDRSLREFNVEERGSFVAGDYHNGPLSVVLPLGLWGVGAFLWLLVAGFRVLWRNYRYGDPALRSINTFLLASQTAGLITFTFIFGNLYSDMLSIAGMLGLSVALNGGVARPTVSPSFKPEVRSKKPGPARIN